MSEAGYWENVRAVRTMSYGIDGLGVLRPVAIEQTGAWSVAIQDQHTQMLFLPFHVETGNSTTLTAPASSGDWQIEVEPGHGISVGDPIVMGRVGSGYYGYAIVVATNTITLGSAIDASYPIGQEVLLFYDQLAVDGSGRPDGRVTSYVTAVPGNDFDVTGMHMEIICQTEPDDSMFGDIAGGLDAGVSLRKVSGDTGELENFGVGSTNGTMSMFTGGEVQYTDKAGGGFFAVRVTASWTRVWGVTVRLVGYRTEGAGITPYNRDELQMVIQDDLSDLVSMRIMAVGHYVIP